MSALCIQPTEKRVVYACNTRVHMMFCLESFYPLVLLCLEEWISFDHSILITWYESEPINCAEMMTNELHRWTKSLHQTLFQWNQTQCSAQVAFGQLHGWKNIEYLKIVCDFNIIIMQMTIGNVTKFFFLAPFKSQWSKIESIEKAIGDGKWEKLNAQKATTTIFFFNKIKNIYRLILPIFRLIVPLIECQMNINSKRFFSFQPVCSQCDHINIFIGQNVDHKLNKSANEMLIWIK